MTDTNSNQPHIATSVPDWNGRVDQSNAEALARFISAMPFAKTITHDELNEITRGAVELASLKPLNVVLKAGEFLIGLGDGIDIGYYCFGGTHASYGNFALLWSVRGPGDGPRPRPCFMFWDDEAAMLKPGYAA